LLKIMATTATVRGVSARGVSGQRAAVASVERAIRSTVREPRSRYLQEFAEAFRIYESRISEAELVARADAADVVLVGDYHSLASCQAFSTSLLNKLTAQGRRGNVLALEAVYSANQPLLEQWSRGEIDDAELPQRLHFARDWGYDWAPYGELFAAARKCEAVCGLDSEPRFDLRRVRTRDRYMAARICEMRQSHPNARIVALLGESHLAPGHLPQLLRQALPDARVFTVLQNVDSLYWQLAEGDALPGPVAIAENITCVFNASPLEKYESYQAYLERWGE
jgi:uncharacterized iron-regulated protein